MTMGNGDLSESRQRRIETGLAAVQEVEQERDDCRRELEQLLVEHKMLSAEHDAMKLAYARMQTEMDAYRRDRDEAVTRLAGFEAIYDAVLTIMKKHRGDARPDVAAVLKAYGDTGQGR